LFEAGTEAVVWQVDQLQREQNGKFKPLDAAIALAHQCVWLAALAGIAFKANVVASTTGEFLRAATELTPRPAVLAHAGTGIIYGHWPDDLTLKSAQNLLSSLRDLAVKSQGNLIVTRCPPAWKRGLRIWGEPRGDRLLMQAVKRELDPRDLFNPGRFIV